MDRNETSVEMKLFARRNLGSILLLGLLITALVTCFFIIKPYIYPIVLAMVAAMVFHPVYQFFLNKTKNRKNVAAGITCLLVGLLVVGPIFGFATALIVKGNNAYSTIEKWINDGKLEETLKDYGLDKESVRLRKLALSEGESTVDPEMETSMKYRVGTWVILAAEKADLDTNNLEDEFKELGENLLAKVAPEALGQAKKGLGIVVSFFLMIFILFYLLKEGADVMNYLLDLSPLKPEHEDMLIKRVKNVTRSAVVGTFLTAVAQGILGMIAFAVVGIPWFFYGVLMGFASLIPVVGTALIWVPCVLYLLIVGHVGMGIGLLIWCVVVVVNADNFLRPYFMKGDTGMSSIIAFFAILGGIEFFGLIGVIFGPLIFGVCAMLLYIFQLEVKAATAAGKLPEEETPKPEKKSDGDDD